MLHSLKCPLILNALDHRCWKTLASLEREHFPLVLPVALSRGPKTVPVHVLLTYLKGSCSQFTCFRVSKGRVSNELSPSLVDTCLSQCLLTWRQTLAVVTSLSCRLRHHGCCNPKVIFLPLACSVHPSRGRPHNKDGERGACDEHVKYGCTRLAEETNLGLTPGC